MLTKIGYVSPELIMSMSNSRRNIFKNNQETHEDKLSKATSASLLIKMIAKPEWTQSNAQQNTEQLRSNPFLQKNFLAVESNIFADNIGISRVLTIILSASM